MDKGERETVIILRTPDDFRRYAGRLQERWDLLIGGTVEHPIHGIGVVRSIILPTKILTRPRVVIKFDEREQFIKFSEFYAIKRMTFPVSSMLHFRKEGVDISELPAPQIPQESKSSISTVPEPEPLADEKQIPSANEIPADTGLQSAGVLSEETTDVVPKPDPFFSIGRKVCMRTEPTKVGMVRKEPEFLEGKWMYTIFFSADDESIITEKDLKGFHEEIRFASDIEFLRDLLLLKLRLPFGDNLYSAYASKTKFEVYQFKPALKFLRGNSQRLLIADEVGLGKTIEAGIIYLELQARLDLPRVLIVCPAGLRLKWQDELKSRFDEEFRLYKKKAFLEFADHYERNNGSERMRGIASLQSLRGAEVVNRINAANIHFDLIIIDEAHHCRNAATLSHRMAVALEEQSDALLLLTATPLQTSNTDLFNLFRIMDPGEFDNFATFEERLTPNKYINRASEILRTGDHQNALTTLQKVERTSQRARFRSNPYYEDVVNLLSKPRLTKGELISAQESLLDLNTLSFYFTRSRRRDVVSNAPIRTAETIMVDYSPDEKEYYNNVINFIKRKYIVEHPGKPVYTWVTMMKERQVASCISAFHQKFHETVDEYLKLTDEDLPDQIFFVDLAAIFIDGEPYRALMKNTAELLRDSDIQVDTKFDMFFSALKKILNEEPDAKVIVFSYFTGTVEYISKKLNQKDIPTTYIHGKVPVPRRQVIIDQFRDDPSIRVLVSSDVGAEGLDFQFCDTIFNFDLPWNPMKVEQRIGRIDRFGQKSNRVRIYNLVIEGTIESRILMRLYDRIGLFKAAIGDIEEILGTEIKTLVEMVYSQNLSPEEETLKVEQTAENIIRRRKQLEEFEKNSLQFMGQDAIFKSRLQQTLDEGGYISENELCALVESFINSYDPSSDLDCNPEKDGTYTFLPNNDLDKEIRSFIIHGCKGDKSALDFLTRLRVGREMPMTFSSERAYERKPLEFVTARHPLTQCARHYWENIPKESELCYRVQVEGDPALAGEYHFFIYTLEMRGTKNKITLEPLIIDPRTGDMHPALSRDFLHLTQKDKEMNRHFYRTDDLDGFRSSEDRARRQMTALRDQQEAAFRKENAMFISARKTALAQSFEAKRDRIQRQLEMVRDPNIHRMREGELRNVTARYEYKMDTLDSSADVTVSFSLHLKGILVISSDEERGEDISD